MLSCGRCDKEITLLMKQSFYQVLVTVFTTKTRVRRQVANRSGRDCGLQHLRRGTGAHTPEGNLVGPLGPKELHSHV